MRQLLITLLASAALASGCGGLPPERTPAVSPSMPASQTPDWMPVNGYPGLAVRSEEPDRLVFQFGSQADTTVAIPCPDAHDGSILSAYRVTGDTVMIERHINPRLTCGVLCDLRKKSVTVSWGTLFAVDQRSFRVACWREPQTNEPDEPGQLFVSGRLLLALTKNDCQSLQWDPAGGLLLTLSDGTELLIYPPGVEPPSDPE